MRLSGIREPWLDVPEDNIWNDTGKFSSPFERFPGTADGLPMQQALFHWYTLVAAVDVPLLILKEDGSHVWAVERHPDNDNRGDESSIDEKQEHMELVGLVDTGGEAWLLTDKPHIQLPMPLKASIGHRWSQH